VSERPPVRTIGPALRARLRDRLNRSVGDPGDAEFSGGHGTPLLALHGLGGTWRVWMPVLPALMRHHQVLAPTLLGHDGALPLDEGAAPRVSTVVDAVEAQLDRHGLDRVHVVGNSLGGWIALELARRGRARSVVAFSPAGAWRSRAQMGAIATLMRVSFAAATLAAGKPGRPEALAEHPRTRRMLMGTQVAHPERLDTAEIAEALRAISRSPIVRPLAKSVMTEPFHTLRPDADVPIRIVWPEHDRVIPFRGFGAPMMDRLPGAEIVRLSSVGHVPMSDDPVSVAERILEVTTARDARDERPAAGA
jgi:pimeloyl-ACP methyl ester carboxylesterase